MVECPTETGTILGEDGLRALLAELGDRPAKTVFETLIWHMGSINPSPDFPDDISGILLDFRG